MDTIFIYLILTGIILVIVSPIIMLVKYAKNKLKKKKKTIISLPLTQSFQTATVSKVDQSYPNIIVKSADHILYEEFMKEYDSGGFKFENVNYRKGAKNTCPFGISEGFKIINKKMEWGYVRLHTGVDRARGGETNNTKDVVICPFNFNRSNIVEYKDRNGKYTSYGTLITLYNDKYQFAMKIAHMDPKKDIVPWSLERLKKGSSFERDWVLGSAGTCGDSSGAHTHTEFISLDDSCEVFDILLEEKYGDKVLVEYSKTEILNEYRKQIHFKDASDSVILKDWDAVKTDRGATFVNKYKYKYQPYGGAKCTRYSSELLFNGL